MGEEKIIVQLKLHIQNVKTQNVRNKICIESLLCNIDKLNLKI